jgi:hypothetical protein
MINLFIIDEADHSLLKKLKHYQSQDLLVCDEIGYLPLGGQTGLKPVLPGHLQAAWKKVY